MNNKGFTLVELIATLVILGLVFGIGFRTLNSNLGETKEKIEEVFVDTLRDAIDIYLSTEFANGNLIVSSNECSKELSKKHDSSVKVYKVTTIVNFRNVIDSSYSPLTKSEFVNPANKDVVGEYECNDEAVIDVYRDEDYVYYYSIDKSALVCLNNIGGEYDTFITNLPVGYSCE